jgi:hypothetical protein
MGILPWGDMDVAVGRGYMSKNKALLCLQRKSPVKRKIFVTFDLSKVRYRLRKDI